MAIPDQSLKIPMDIAAQSQTGSRFKLSFAACRLIILLVTRQAIKDYKFQANSYARDWLLISAPYWLDLAEIEFSPDRWREWVLSGCQGGYWRRYHKRGRQAA